jgi:K+-sensing histidine kinase KdpD
MKGRNDPGGSRRILAGRVVITSANIDNRKVHGLGYLIIKDLAKAMNATLSIESRRRKGRRVMITAPVVNSQ